MDEVREEAAAIVREARVLLERERGRGRVRIPVQGTGGTTRRARSTPAEGRREQRPEDSFRPSPASESTPAAQPALLELTTTAVAPRADLPQDLRELATLVSTCRKCGLCETRTQTVFADGDARARLIFVGEAPGRDEDAQGVPFVGRAGQLLNKMIAAIELKREDVYICNVLKCRPPENRTPAPDEVEQCRPYLEQQIALVKPALICALGLSAMQALLQTKASMGSMRGRTFEYRGVPLIPTYHPAALLRNPSLKHEAWVDLQRVRDLLRAGSAA